MTETGPPAVPPGPIRPPGVQVLFWPENSVRAFFDVPERIVFHAEFARQNLGTRFMMRMGALEYEVEITGIVLRPDLGGAEITLTRTEPC